MVSNQSRICSRKKRIKMQKVADKLIMSTAILCTSEINNDFNDLSILLILNNK